MKANPEKCHLVMNVNTSVTIIKGEHTISNSYFEKQLGVKIDSPLNSTTEGTCYGYNYIIYVHFKKKVTSKCFFKNSI